MFGKRSKMSANEKAVMAIGRAVGNLKGTNVGNNHGGKGGKSGKETPNPYGKRKLSPGNAGPMKLT